MRQDMGYQKRLRDKTRVPPGRTLTKEARKGRHLSSNQASDRRSFRTSSMPQLPILIANRYRISFVAIYIGLVLLADLVCKY